VPIDQLLTEKS